MAKTVWLKVEELHAFALGQAAARAGMARHPWAKCRTYNERAAFNDGWDSVAAGGGRSRPRDAGASGNAE